MDPTVRDQGLPGQVAVLSRTTIKGAAAMKPKLRDVFSEKTYKGFKLEDVIHRPGALEILKRPSRYGSLLSYPRFYNKNR